MPRFCLRGVGRRSISLSMFLVDEQTAEAIRKAYAESGELSAVVELRRRFPGITDNANARLYVRAIASWQPLPPKRLRQRKRK